MTVILEYLVYTYVYVTLNLGYIKLVQKLLNAVGAFR